MQLSKYLKRALTWFTTFLVLLGAWNSVRSKYQPVPALEVWALSVGQGESVFLREATGKKILFDGGPSNAVLDELSTIMPFWDHDIDLIILSHNHTDHLHGLLSVLEHYNVKEAWISGAIEDSDDFREWRKLLVEKHVATSIVKAGYTAQVGSLKFRVLYPVKSEEGLTPADQHDATVVTKVSYQSQSVLLTGDLDEHHETEIMNNCRAPTCSLQAQVLQIPHHGAKTGLLPAFLTSVSPQVAFICVGQKNIYHHPAPQTTKKLDDANLHYFRTDLDGEAHFILYGDHTTYEKVAGSTPR